MNFASDKTTERDLLLMFGELDGTLKEPVITFDHDTATLADIVVMMGVFKSKTQANKNGWGGPIPMGFKEHKGIGKRANFWTFKPNLDWKDNDDV